jgi:hypothetical protein
MTIDPDKSLSDNLADLGCTHRPSPTYTKREILREDGTIVGAFDAQEAWDELAKRPGISNDRSQHE